MAPDLTTIIGRVARVRDDVARGQPLEAPLAEIEDALTEGYLWALEADDWSMRTEQRLHDLLSDLSAPARGQTLKVLANEHTRFQRDLISLRHELAELRRERDRLHARPRAHSA